MGSAPVRVAFQELSLIGEHATHMLRKRTKAPLFHEKRSSGTTPVVCNRGYAAAGGDEQPNYQRGSTAPNRGLRYGRRAL